MSLPPEVTAIAERLLSFAGGFLGGSSLMAYIRPANLQQAIVRILISTISAMAISPAIAFKLFERVDADVVMGIAFVVGFIAWNVLGAVAMFFNNRQGQDVIEMIKATKTDKE